MKICTSHISDNYIDNMYSQGLIIRKQKTQICKKMSKNFSRHITKDT